MDQMRAYVLFAVGQNYIDKIQILVDYLLRYSTYKIVLCYSEGSVTFTNERLISIYMDIPYVIDFNVGKHKPSSVRNVYLMSFKQNACQLAIQNTKCDEFVYLDSDVLPTPNIDSMFDVWSEQCTNYPLLSKYPPNYYFIEGRPLVLDKVLNILGISRNKQSVYSLCAGFFFFNRNCLPFIKTWSSFIQSKEYIDAFVKPDEFGNIEICQYTDEGAGNALMWLYDHSKYIAPMVWTSQSNCVKYVLTSYKQPTVITFHPDYPQTYAWTPDEYSYPYVGNASVFPINKNDLFAFHAIKDYKEFELGIKYVDELY
jgi:hypothetical protein